ncbi:hypothetical protein [Metabacillus iocasae]|uniref:DnaJ-class molecular chaperone n=1 Tax=Priestia iocasae TaxID=2291674 RepID=A0ABS2QVE2_9BACI|nr:hypothetical protein [Metabacillus iocasae]MBM7703424.1 DnaJ-class molecular chaperone [Metabacillus iocasae]
MPEPGSFATGNCSELLKGLIVKPESEVSMMGIYVLCPGCDGKKQCKKGWRLFSRKLKCEQCQGTGKTEYLGRL